MKDQIEHFKSLSQKLKDLSEKKIRFEEQYKSKREDLGKLVQEIKSAGYDPKDLASTIKVKEEALKVAISTFEEDLQKVSAQLSEIENQ